MRIILKTLFTITIAIAFVSCQSKSTKADKLWLDNSFYEAVELFQEAANEGDSYAKWRLSEAYATGTGTELNLVTSLKLLKEAANEGSEEAKCDMARCFLHGMLNVEKDEEKGKKMLVELVEKTDCPYVLSAYARELLHGWIFEKDPEKALYILDKVKDKKNRYYCRAMGEIYMLGTDKVDIDYKKALSFFEKAYEKGSGYSAYIIGLLYLKGQGSITKDIDKGIDWFKKGIERNDSYCMQSMGEIYLSEDSLLASTHDISKGVEYLKKSSRHGNGEASAELGGLYETGKYIGKDDAKAFEYYTKAYDLQSGQGAYALGWAYINGIGCSKDVAKGIEIWKTAVVWGSSSAANNLYCYYAGEKQFNGVIDKENAKFYLEKGASLNDAMSCWNLAREYWGMGSNLNLYEKNEQQAFTYAKKAADSGIVDACGFIGYCYANGIGCVKDPKEAKKYQDMTKPDGSNDSK